MADESNQQGKPRESEKAKPKVWYTPQEFISPINCVRWIAMQVQNETTLSCAERGQFLCVRLEANDEGAIRLKRLGICEGRELELISTGDPTVVRVCGSRIGLSHELAKRIVVRPASSNG